MISRADFRYTEELSEQLEALCTGLRDSHSVRYKQYKL